MAMVIMNITRYTMIYPINIIGIFLTFSISLKVSMAKKTGSIVNCKDCSKEFYVQRSLIEIGKGKYCSKICANKNSIHLAIEASRGKPKPGKKKGKILLCYTCSKEFYIAKKRLEKGVAKYCSRSCLAKDLLHKYVGIHGFQKLGKSLHTYKYIYIDGNRIREHRWLMEQHLGRKLERWEHVHHINDDSSDNRIKNLEVLSNSDHQRKEYLFRKKLISSS